MGLEKAKVVIAEKREAGEALKDESWNVEFFDDGVKPREADAGDDAAGRRGGGAEMVL